MNIKLKTGQVIRLGDKERLVETRVCPKCGGQLISNYAYYMEIVFCTSCPYTDVDYNEKYS